MLATIRETYPALVRHEDLRQPDEGEEDPQARSQESGAVN
jgi:hypothetical protein